MNNAFILKEDVLKEDSKNDPSPLLHQRAEQLTEMIEALENIGSSSYWKVLKKFVFDVDLAKARRSLAKEKDTTEMFRLQGEIRWGEKLSIENLLVKYRNELVTIKSKINHG